MKRELWVDIAKGIAIIAVVIGHIDYNYPQYGLLPIADILSDFWHVPVFFIIGGFFIKEDKLVKPVSFIKGKIDSLYKLLLYVYIPVLFLHNFFINIGFYDLNIDYSGKFVTVWDGKDMVVNILKAVFFAGREPLLGAMWFVYVLFAALVCFCVFSWGIKKFVRDNAVYEKVRFVVFLLLAVISCTMTNVYDFTIPRFNNVFTALWLLYIGMLLNQRKRIEYNNVFVLCVCLLLVFHMMVIHSGSVALNTNKYVDVVLLTVSSVSCLYIVCFSSKVIQQTSIGKLIGVIGKESFYIMALQFFGFKICTMFVSLFGVERDLAQLKAPTGDSIIMYILYLVFGVFVPIVAIYIIRYIKNSCLNFCFKNK